MARNQLNAKIRLELCKFLEQLQKMRAELPKPKLSDRTLALMASEHFGRVFSPNHVRNTRIMFNISTKSMRQLVKKTIEPLTEIRTERRINKKVFRCDCGQKFTIRIRKCK